MGALSLDRDDLDEVDRSLLRGLRSDGRSSFASLGAAVGLSADAVRERLKRLERARVMRVVGSVDPALLGYRSFALVGLKTQGALAPILARLEKVDEIDFIVCTAGAVEIFVEVVCRDDAHLLAVVSERIRTIPGVVLSETFAYLSVAKWAQGGHRQPRRGEAPTVELDDLDRRIVAHLQRDGRVGYQELSTALKQPYSIMRRRAQSLIESGVVQIVTDVDRVAGGLGLMAGLALRTEGKRKPTLDALAALPEVEIALVTTGSFDVLLEVACADKAHLAELVGERIRAIRGVRACETLTYLDVVKLPLTWRIPSAS